MKVLKTPNTSRTGRFITALKEEWGNKFKDIFQYLSTQNLECVIPYDIEEMDNKYRHLDKIMDISNNLALIDYRFHYYTDEIVLVNIVDIEFASEFIGRTKTANGKLTETQGKRLAELYRQYGENPFTSSDVKDIFNDTFRTSEVARSQLLKPGVNAKILNVDEGERPYRYTFFDKYDAPEADEVAKLDSLSVDDNYLKYEYSLEFVPKHIKPIDIVREIPIPIYYNMGKKKEVQKGLV